MICTIIGIMRGLFITPVVDYLWVNNIVPVYLARVVNGILPLSPTPPPGVTRRPGLIMTVIRIPTLDMQIAGVIRPS